MNSEHKFSFVSTVLFGAVLVAGLALLAGCPANSSSSSSASAMPGARGAALSGTVFGGRQPVVGSAITVYMAGTGGTPAPVIATATTDARGNFTVASFSPVPGTGAIVYVTAAGGDGSGSGSSNTAILMGTVAGVCEDYGCTNLSNVNVNELATTAMVYSMGGFTSITGTSVNVAVQGNDTNAVAGLTNAVNTFANLVNPANGTDRVPGTNDGSACTGSGEPVNCMALETLNTLANIVATCVNSPSAGVGACTGFFNATTTSGGSVPGNVFQALYNVVTDPGVRGAGTALFALNPLTKIYNPGLDAAPNAWIVALNYTDNGLNNPAGLAIDASGNVWLTNTTDDTISKFGNDGTALGNFTDSNLNGIHDIAVDLNGDVWVTSKADVLGLLGGSISKFSNDGGYIGTYTGGLIGILLKIGNPQGIAVGPAGNVWLPSSGLLSLLLPTLASFSTAGTQLTSLSLQGLLSSDPRAIAMDADDNVWVADGSEAVQFNGSSQTATASGNGLGSLQALAVDSANNLWVANGDGSVSAFTSSGTAIGHWTLSGTGTGTKDGIAVDAAGEAWASNSSGNAVSLFTQTGGLLGSYDGGGLNSPQGLAVDSSGNLWVANEGSPNSVTEFIGIAAPTVTPIASALVNGFTP